MSGSTYSTAEVATLTGLSANTIRRRIESGEISAEMVGGNWRVSADEALRIKPPPEEVDDSSPTGSQPGDKVLAAVEAAVRDRIANLPLILTTAQVAELLGESEWTIRNDCRTGRIPHERRGRRIQIPLTSLLAIFRRTLEHAS